MDEKTTTPTPEPLPANATANGHDSSRPRKPNRAWFKPGDHRINRPGRPVGKTAGPGEGLRPIDLGLGADRLMLLKIPSRDLLQRLTRKVAPFVKNLLPHDHPQVTIVGGRVDEKATVLVLRSPSFKKIARRALIPEFQPRLDGAWTPL